MNCNEIDIFSGNTAIIGVAGADMSRGQLGASMPPSSVRKNVPKSTNPLKSFNWSKLPDCKVNNFFYDKLHDYPGKKSLPFLLHYIPIHISGKRNDMDRTR